MVSIQREADEDIANRGSSIHNPSLLRHVGSQNVHLLTAGDISIRLLSSVLFDSCVPSHRCR